MHFNDVFNSGFILGIVLLTQSNSTLAEMYNSDQQHKCLRDILLIKIQNKSRLRMKRLYLLKNVSENYLTIILRELVFVPSLICTKYIPFDSEDTL